MLDQCPCVLHVLGGWWVGGQHPPPHWSWELLGWWVFPKTWVDGYGKSPMDKHITGKELDHTGSV